MSFLPAQDDDEVMTEINMTPLIDVMLVLLIVFILAVPAIHSAIPLVLPRASSAAPQQPAEPVRLDIDVVVARPQRLCRRRDPDGRIPHAVGKPDVDNVAKLAMENESMRPSTPPATTMSASPIAIIR